MIKKDILKYKYKKALGTDAIPPKLVKLPSNFVAPHFLNVINTGITYTTFRQNTKVALVVSLDKGKSNKNYTQIFGR